MKFCIAKQVDTSQNTRQQLNAKYEIVSIHKNRELAEKNYNPDILPITEIIKISDDLKKGEIINISGEYWFSVLGHGGIRNGAGRPLAPPLLKKRAISVKLPEWLILWIDDQPNMNRAILIEDALSKLHNLNKPVKT